MKLKRLCVRSIKRLASWQDDFVGTGVPDGPFLALLLGELAAVRNEPLTERVESELFNL